MTKAFLGNSVDCTDAAEVARFWRAVLDRWVADGATSENAVLLAEDEAKSGPRLRVGSGRGVALVPEKGEAS
jgi:hypothetical protein